MFFGIQLFTVGMLYDFICVSYMRKLFKNIIKHLIKTFYVIKYINFLRWH